jgi:hypothetical protein
MEMITMIKESRINRLFPMFKKKREEINCLDPNSDLKQIDKELSIVIPLLDEMILLLTKQESSSEMQKWEFTKEKKKTITLTNYDEKISVLLKIYERLEEYQLSIEQDYEVLNVLLLNIMHKETIINVNNLYKLREAFQTCFNESKNLNWFYRLKLLDLNSLIDALYCCLD